MSTKKKIPCRVCGKMFEPCAYCQAHADTFRWRNFACSRECATKYMDETIKYRESLKHKENKTVQMPEVVNGNDLIDSPATAKKKQNKKNITDIESENKKTE